MGDFSRITQDPAIMGGKPCIRGQRSVTLGHVAAHLPVIEVLCQRCDRRGRNSAPPGCWRSTVQTRRCLRFYLS